ncbi:MAG: delta subunit of the central stalk of mitochondrial F1F0 ATP synthase, atp16 [Paramarteilia canceri]
MMLAQLVLGRSSLSRALSSISGNESQQKLLLSLISSKKALYFQTPVNQVDIPGKDGDLGILKNHLPVLGQIKEGNISIFREENSEKEEIEVSSGIYMMSDNNHLNIIAEIPEKNFNKQEKAESDSEIEKNLGKGLRRDVKESYRKETVNKNE